MYKPTVEHTRTDSGGFYKNCNMSKGPSDELYTRFSFVERVFKVSPSLKGSEDMASVR